MKLSSMQTAPKNRPILVWHDHDSDPYYETHPVREGLITVPEMTIYAAHCEGLTIRREKGYCVAVWGGEINEDESGEGWGPWIRIPNWWFDAYSEFGIPLAPLGWVELDEPELPTGS